MSSVLFWGFVLCRWSLSEGLANNLALTPPMGWTSWGRFRCNVDCKNFPKECISEWLFRDMADKIIEDDYISFGYEYVLIDDCWLAKTRDSYGRLQPDPKRFPSGIKNLSDYIHARGLKLGIYEDYGKKTCEGYPGILPETMEKDVKTLVSWGIDYIKIDGCYSDPLSMIPGYEKLGRWLLYTGRPVVYSCSWPFYQQHIGLTVNYTAAAEMCNLWRNCGDIQDSWRSVRDILNYVGDHQNEFASYAGAGHWNDPDMLVIGNFGLSFEQAKVQMALWAILAAPLIMTSDLRVTHPEFRGILQNLNLIQINQDPLGIQGRRIYINRRGRYEVWARPVTPVGINRVSWALAIVNLDDAGEPKSIAFPMKYTQIWGALECYDFIDLLDPNCDVRFSNRGALLTRVPPLGVKIYKATLKNVLK